MNMRRPINLALAFLATLMLAAGAAVGVSAVLPLILANSKWAEVGAVGCLLFAVLGGAVRAYRRKAQSKQS